MPLTLITGPANAEKARVVLDEYSAAIDRDPVLVVPRFADVDHYRRELAERGAVFGVEVVHFPRFLDVLARRGGVRGRALGRLSRERLAAAAIGQASLTVLKRSARTPGFVAAFLRLVDELEERRVDPGRWYRAMRSWGGSDPARAAYAEELAALYAAYRRGLEGMGRLDGTLRAQAALDALRLAPESWSPPARRTPVFFYGFDDLSPLQRDVVETLAHGVGTDVTVSLTYEAGRAAFAGRGETFQELVALAERHLALEASAEHYAAGSSGPLHHLERGLFADDPAEAEPAGAVRLLEGGGEREEIELVGAEAARLVRDEGIAPEEIAVVLRRPREAAALVEQVFAAYGLDAAVDRRFRAGHTAVGRGLVAVLRCALLEGSADDLLAWLRTPGLLEKPPLADGLEAEARRKGARSAEAARALWEAAHPTFRLEEIDRIRAAHDRGRQALFEHLARVAQRLAAAPWRGQARVLDRAEGLDLRVGAALRRALDELAELARADRRLAPAPDELAQLLTDLEVPAGALQRPGAVTVTSPLELRARRVRALFCCGLQEGVFPAAGRPEPFLGDAERRAINAVSGLRLRLREDALGGERYLFYAAVSRPTDRLYLSWHAADEDGDPAVPSLFVADVRDLFDASLWEARAQRPLGAAGWAGPAAPTDHQRRRAAAVAASGPAPPAIGPLRHPAVLGALRERPTWSASALELWSSCPVKWYVERLLKPAELEPDPEPVVRGEFAHAVLEDALRALRAAGGRLEPERLDDVKRLVHDALARLAPQYTISVNPERLRSQLRRLEADLLRYLEHAAVAGSAYAPEHFELRFGGPEDEHAPVALAGGALELQGRIDRVDVDPSGRRAIVYDYKGKAAPPQAKWVADGKLQVGLYMLALRGLLGLEAVGGMYQPLGASDPRPRGLLLAEEDPGLDAVGTDRVAAPEFEAVLDAVERAAAEAVGQIRAGALEPRPDSCAWRGGCSYPSICRCEPS